MAKLESYSNLSKLQEDLWKKNFCSNFNLGLSLYSKTSDLTVKSSFTQNSSDKGHTTFGSTYFQYKTPQWLFKDQFTSASLLKSTIEYVPPQVPQAKLKVELETSKPEVYKSNISGEYSHANYKAKGALVNFNDLKLSSVFGSNGNGLGIDLVFKLDTKNLSALGLALWTYKPTWRGVLKYTCVDKDSLALGDVSGSLYLARCENYSFGAAVGWKNQALSVQGVGQWNVKDGQIVKARVDQDGKLGLALRTKVGGVTFVNGTEFSLLDHTGTFKYGFRVKINQ